jgi:type II secretory pathway component HofQ
LGSSPGGGTSNKNLKNTTMEIAKLTTDIKSYFDRVREAVKEGDVNPLDAQIFFNELDKGFKALKGNIKDEVMMEAEKYDGQDYAGYRVQVSQGNRSYDFSHIQEWIEAKEKLKEIEENAKAAAQQAERNALLVTSDGEVHEAARVKYTAPYVKLTKKKS